MTKSSASFASNASHAEMTPVVANAYVIAPDEDISQLPTSIVHLDQNHHAFYVSHEYTHIPEARDVSWGDDFFGNDRDVVAVFDFDYEAMEEYYSRLGWICFGSTIFFPNIFCLALMTFTPCYLERNVKWYNRAMHVAVTRYGIRIVHAKRPTCWGNPCTDAGPYSKLVCCFCLLTAMLHTFCKLEHLLTIPVSYTADSF
jgi:hypothetical protein